MVVGILAVIEIAFGDSQSEEAPERFAQIRDLAHQAKSGSTATVIAVGPMLEETLRAVEDLSGLTRLCAAYQSTIASGCGPTTPTLPLPKGVTDAATVLFV